MEEQNTLIFQDTYTYMSDAHDEMIPLESELVLWWRDSFYSYSFSLMFISEASFSTIFDVLNRGFGVFQMCTTTARCSQNQKENAFPFIPQWSSRSVGLFSNLWQSKTIFDSFTNLPVVYIISVHL